MKKKADYPQHLSFIERLAKKVITRVVSDGIGLDNAIKEATHLAKLNTQQIFHLCSVLEDMGQVFNGDPKNYYFTLDEMGKAFPATENGYVVYASVDKQPKMNSVFKVVEALKKEGFTDQDILAINSELQEVLNVISEFNSDYKTLVSDYEQAKAQPAQPDKNWLEKGKDWVGQQVQNIMPQPGLAPVPAAADGIKVVIAQTGDIEVEEATPANVEKLEEAPADLEVAEDDLGLPEEGADLEVAEDDLGAGAGVSAKITPTPEELMEKLKAAPKWEVQNVLSMQKAENFYKDLQKELDAVAYNPNIVMDLNSISQYDKVRAAIAASQDKISEAQKGVEKIEKKENELEQKYETPAEAPTDQIIAEEPIVEEEPLAPAPAPQLA